MQLSILAIQPRSFDIKLASKKEQFLNSYFSMFFLFFLCIRGILII